jgi:hypothetical protein
MDATRVKGATDIPAYMAASVTFSATAAATVVFEITQPATPTRLVRVHRVLFSATQTTAGNIGDWRLELGSTSTTGGTSASVTAVPVDSSQLSASASVKNFTANGNAGTLIGIIYQPRMLVPAPATAINPATVIDFDTTSLLNGRPITLRKAGESLRLNFGGGTIPSGLANCQATIYWTEEPIPNGTAYKAQ